MGNIAFPGLNISLDVNRVAFGIFGKPIYWYAIIIACGLVLAVFYTLRRHKAFGITEDWLINFLFIAIPVGIIGARLYYVVFNLSLYQENPLEAFYIWEGGMAIYGAVIACVAAAYIYCKKTKVSFGALIDIGALGLLIGQAIGRWGNFINREAYGSVTDLPWRMTLTEYSTSSVIANVHPTFLYESLWNIMGFIVLHFYSKKRKFDGEIFLWYVVWYGIGRSIIEGLREDSLYLFGTGIRVSQLLAVLSAVVGIGILIYAYSKKKSYRLADHISETSQPDAESDTGKNSGIDDDSDICGCCSLTDDNIPDNETENETADDSVDEAAGDALNDTEDL